MATPRVLVYGGKGALGSTIVNFFKGKNWVGLPYLFYLSLCLEVACYYMNLGFLSRKRHIIAHKQTPKAHNLCIK